MYRPFDSRYIYYERGLTSRPAFNVMQHMLNDNLALLSCRQQSSFDFQHVFISNELVQVCTVSLQTKETTYVFPLYLYPDENILDKTEQRRPNLNIDIVNAIMEKVNLTFTIEKQETENTCAPIDILDYIYAVLYSNKYRQKYKEFLKLDFPRVPYPENSQQFYSLSAIGSMLRNLHLMESITPDKDLAIFPVAGSNVIESIKYKEGKVYINKTQYFENVPPETWDYYIGGYQPSQRWLKDRKGRTLDFSEKEHYQKIIVAISNTINLQAQIDEVLIIR
jgi:predicted helicase